MVLRLASDLPLLWRTPSSVQFGSDHPVAVIEDLTEAEDRLLATLATGISESGFAMLARSLEVEEDVAERLLRAVAPALEQDADPTPAGRAAVLGRSPLAGAIARMLDSAGALASPDESSLVVLTADWVIAPADHLRWLNRDILHLPVVVSERSVTVGPLVEPGLSPCLHCVHRHRIDADPSWTAVATQLLAREPRDLDPLDVAETASFVARRVLARLRGEPGGGMSWRLAADGISSRVWRRHPDCRCAAPEGTDWATAPDRAPRAAPRRVSAAAVRA